MHIHLDPLGGIAGDMFIAALLDAWPEQRDGLEAAVRAAGLPAGYGLDLIPHGDHALTGARFRVAREGGPEPHPAGAYRDIAARLRAAALEPAVRERALAMFALLAGAEGRVHGVPAEEVTFHELAGWDSVADVVGAAFLIERLGARSWSTAALPLGRGRVATAHGPLPVPAPATALLLEGFVLVDDGIEGERVTPTGAAILRHLEAGSGPSAEPLRLLRSGTGFGTRKLPGISNALRLLAFECVAAGEAITDEVGEIAFEVDDQSPEELALGLEALRAEDGVLDVLQTPAFGKKGRMVMAVRVLCRPDVLERTIDLCFAETTTIGLRWSRTRRRVLPRRALTAEGIPVKRVERPGGRRTAKAESDALAALPGGAEGRGRRRREAEAAALEAPEDD